MTVKPAAFDRTATSARKSTAIDAQIGARIRSLRDQRRTTQSALAERLGLSLQQVQKYESGETRLPASRVVQIADALGASVAEIMAASPRSENETAATAAVSARPAEFVELVTAFAAIRNSESRAKLVDMAKFLAQIDAATAMNAASDTDE